MILRIRRIQSTSENAEKMDEETRTNIEVDVRINDTVHHLIGFHIYFICSHSEKLNCRFLWPVRTKNVRAKFFLSKIYNLNWQVLKWNFFFSSFLITRSIWPNKIWLIKLFSYTLKKIPSSILECFMSITIDHFLHWKLYKSS